MTAKFFGDEILKYTNGRLAAGYMPHGQGSICTDSRQLIEGQWYLALSGESFDGHQFLGDAFARGAIGCIVAQRPSYAIGNQSFPLIAVDDTLAAYHSLARVWRDKVNPTVIAITGSSGKTTAKEMCASALSMARRVHKSKSNENNQVGVPKTILSMPENTQVLVLEMAMRGAGEIAEIAEVGRPNIGVIVNVGSAHVGRLGSLDNIIAAKCELLEKLDTKSGIAIIGAPTDALLKRVNEVFQGKILKFDSKDIVEVAVTADDTQLQIKPSDVVFSLRAHGLAQIQDAWCAIAAARAVGLDDESIAAGLKHYHPIPGRGNKIKASSGAVIIDEAYNANPDSVISSVSVFLDDRVVSNEHKYVVLGDMAELGKEEEKMHESLGRWLKDKKISGLITVGKLAANIAVGAQGAKYKVIVCKDKQEAENVLTPLLTPNTAVLIKASHSASLDRLVSYLVAH